MLGAASDKHVEVFDALKDAMDTSSNKQAKVCRVLDGVYHSDGGYDEAQNEHENCWLDLGPESPEERKSAINARIADAIIAGISEDHLGRGSCTHTSGHNRS